MTWDYRLVEVDSGETTLAAIYYDEAGEVIGYNLGYTQPWLRWESREDVDLDLMVKACHRPSIKKSELPS